MAHEVKQLGVDDLDLFTELMTVFGEAFAEMDTYTEQPPRKNYLRCLLASDTFITLVATKHNKVVAGLVAYELKKFEQERSEIYIYDLAVSLEHRREGIATDLIRDLKKRALGRNAHVIFVQADTDAEDQPAISLYNKLGVQENVLHFDITVTENTP